MYLKKSNINLKRMRNFSHPRKFKVNTLKVTFYVALHAQLMKLIFFTSIEMMARRLWNAIVNVRY